jgi:hypothetical protein
VHYPMDTLIGMVIGALVGFLIYKLHAGLNYRGPYGFSARYPVPLKAMAPSRSRGAIRRGPGYVKTIRGQRPKAGLTHV